MSTATTESISPPDTKSGIVRASSVVGTLTLASRFLGLARDTAIATFFGAGAATDAFFVAFKVGNLLRRLVAEGSLSIAFVPVFTEELATSKEAAQAALRSVATCVLLLTVVLSCAGIVWSEEITALFAPGFVLDSQKFELAVSLMRTLFPYVILVSMLALANSALNALGYFAFPAAAPSILNIAMLVGVLGLRGFFNPPVYVLAWAVLIGGICALLPQVLLLQRAGFSLMPTLHWARGPLRRLGLMMVPAALSASLYQLMVFINTLLASLLPEGSVSWLYYADRLFQFPLGVFSLAIATALLPALSQSNAQNDQHAFTQQLSQTIRWVSYITIPAACGLIMLATPILSVIYERGSFTPEYTAKTADALRAYAVGLWAISCHTVLVRAYLAKRHTLIPSVVAFAAVLLNGVLALALMGPAHTTQTTALGSLLSTAQQLVAVANLSHAGLALAGSLASICSCILLWLFLGKIQSRVSFAAVGMSILKTLVATIAMAMLLALLKSTALPNLLLLAVGIPLGALSFLGTSYVLSSNEAQISISLLGKLFPSLLRLHK